MDPTTSRKSSSTSLDPDVVAGDERRAVVGARAPELAVDLHHPVPPDDALVADQALHADGSRLARGAQRLA